MASQTTRSGVRSGKAIFTLFEDVTNFTKAGGGCESCIPEIEKILKEEWAERVVEKVTAPRKKLTNIQKIAMIQDVMEKEIRPLLQADNGDAELIDVDGKKVIISLRGSCTGCMMADVTVKNIEKRLKDLVSEELEVTVE
jgi:NifU-like protein